MVKVPLMCSVTKQQPEEGGQCSKRDWTARLISTGEAGERISSVYTIDPDGQGAFDVFCD